MKKALLLLATSVMMLVLDGGAAVAAVSSAADPGTVNTDGRVSAILAVGDRVYIGGGFTQVDGVPRNHLAAIDATTGRLIGWNPDANGNVLALAASADGSRIYAGGGFTSVGGVTRRRLVSLDATSGAVDGRFKTALGSTVRAIAVSGNGVYVGGDFASVKGQPRSRLALLDGITGALDPNWAPAADGGVTTLAFSPDGGRLYAGGGFASISGQDAPNLAGLDPVQGAVVWRPLAAPNGRVYSIVAQGADVYSAEGGGGGAAAAYDAATGDALWSRNGDGNVQAISVLDGTLYIGGQFGSTFSGQPRRFFVAVDATTGALDPWNPTGGGPGGGVYALAANPAGTRLYAGGDFTKISGVPHAHFAQFSG